MECTLVTERLTDKLFRRKRLYLSVLCRFPDDPTEMLAKFLVRANELICFRQKNIDASGASS